MPKIVAVHHVTKLSDLASPVQELYPQLLPPLTGSTHTLSTLAKWLPPNAKNNHPTNVGTATFFYKLTFRAATNTRINTPLSLGGSSNYRDCIR